MNDPHSWYPFSAFKFFLIIFRIHFTKELSAIIMIKNELGGRPVRLKVNWCQKSAKALCRKHYGVHLFCQRDTLGNTRFSGFQEAGYFLVFRPVLSSVLSCRRGYEAVFRDWSGCRAEWKGRCSASLRRRFSPPYPGGHRCSRWSRSCCDQATPESLSWRLHSSKEARRKCGEDRGSG